MSVRVGDEIVAGGQGDMYTKAQVDALIASAIAQTTEKPGMIKPFAGTTVPTGYLLCDGSAVSRTTYANLFAAIGTTYGSGDGSTTFNLPNMYLRMPMYSGLGSMGATSDGSVPNITGGFNTGDRRTHITGTSGALYKTTVSSNHWGMGSGDTGNTQGVGFNASLSSLCYGRYGDDKIIPSFIHIPWYIKY